MLRVLQERTPICQACDALHDTSAKPPCHKLATSFAHIMQQKDYLDQELKAKIVKGDFTNALVCEQVMKQDS